MGVRLTTGERRTIWISSALFLVILLFMFFLGLFLDVKQDNPFLPGFYWVTDIIAATSAAILASTISGFFKITLDRRFGKKGRYFLQATGGFAVFIVIMWFSPRAQMFDLADTVFSNLVQHCSQAVSDPQKNPNGKALCTKLAEQYPNRPEPWSYLGRIEHRNNRTEKGFHKASKYYEKALNLYGYAIESSNKIDSNNILGKYDLINFSEILLSYAFANADYTITAYHRKSIQVEMFSAGLDKSQKAFEYSLEITEGKAGETFIAKAYDGLGKISLYRFFMLGPKKKDYLNDAITYFDKAIESNSRYTMYLVYHKFVATLLLNSEKEHREAEDIDSEKRIFERFLNEWTIYFDNIYNAADWTFTKNLMNDLVKNKRIEPYAITRPFGSTEYAGKEFYNFLKREPQLKKRLLGFIS